MRPGHRWSRLNPRVDPDEFPCRRDPPAALLNWWSALVRRAGARPPLAEYTRQLWGSRAFILEFSRAKNAAGYSRSVLGQAWQVLTPLQNAGVYYLIFGVLLSTRHGVHNFIAFLVIGIFIFTFTFTQSSMIDGARSISGNLGLTRVLHFSARGPTDRLDAGRLEALRRVDGRDDPDRAGTGERPRLRWLLLAPAAALQAMFCLGLACIIARVGAKVPDTSQVLPFVLRTWLYVSGVFYSIHAVTAGQGAVITYLLTLNPGAGYVQLTRDALLPGNAPNAPYQWWYAAGWALVALTAG